MSDVASDHAEPLPEGEDRRPRTWLVLLVAAVVAVGGGVLAPLPWPDGAGTVRLFGSGRTELTSVPIQVVKGTSGPLRMGGTATERVYEVTLPGGDALRGTVTYTVTLPRGVTTRTKITARIGAAVRVEPLPPSFESVPLEDRSEVSIAVVREDGSRDRVPAVGWDEEAKAWTVRPSLGEVRLEAELSDGRKELIPLLGWDDEAKVLKAERRPPVDSAVVLGLLCLIVVLWVTEVLSLHVTALVVPVVLVVAGVGTAKEALAPFFHPIIALFFGGFMMAESMRRVRLDHLAAVTLVTWGGRNPIALFGTILGVSAFLSMWMSNTASTAVLLPIVLAVTVPLGSRAFTKMAVLGLAYAATIGGVGSAVGTPANPIAIDFLDTFAGREIAFVDWFAFGLPMVVIFVPIMGAFLWWRMGVKLDGGRFASARWVALREYARVRRPTREQWTVIAVFAGVMAVWLTQTWHGIHVGIVAVAGVVVLGVLGKLKTEDLGRISWSALLTFGGGITLGVFMVQSGTSDWVATRLEALEGLPSFFAISAVAVLALALTAVASNTATAAMLVPLAIPLATVLHIDPVLLVVVVAIASSVDFALVIGTPPTMIAYSTRLFTAREIFRAGIVLDLIGIVILVTAVVGLWYVFGVI